METLVTGGAGFIGSHIVDALIEKGHTVSVIDNLSTGHLKNINRCASFYQMDLNSTELDHVFEKHKPQFVFHAAAQASVVTSLKDPAADARSNILGALNLFRACDVFGVRSVVYSSTGGALYGNPKDLPCRETHPIFPMSPYGISKYSVEHYLQFYSETSRLVSTILRYGNVYGPRQDPNGEAGVVAIFANRMANDEPITIFGEGDQERDFVYVSDVVKANIASMDMFDNKVCNIGTGIGVNINTIFSTLAKITSYSKPPQYKPARPGEVYKIYLDSSQANQDLGWYPTVNLDHGLQLTAKYFSVNP